MPRYRSLHERLVATDRRDDIDDGLGGHGSICLLEDQVWVAGSLDHAVRAVGRQGGRLVLRRHPGGVTPTTGCQDDQWLVAEVGERCSFVFRCIGLEELVDGAAKTG